MELAVGANYCCLLLLWRIALVRTTDRAEVGGAALSAYFLLFVFGGTRRVCYVGERFICRAD